MEFDEIELKEMGMCRCCLSEECYKDLSTEYTCMEEREVYADMLLECFDISISQHIEGPNDPNSMICEVCITRLRDACNFKKQVLASEEKFVDMVGRGEFKARVAYTEPMTSEMMLDLQPVEETEVEYLDDDMDYDDGTKDDPEPTVSEDITVTAPPVKAKRGRPKRTVVKPEKKKPKAEEKTKITKGITIKKEYQESYLERLATIRRNIMMLLHYGNVIPFNWNTRGFRCFYCGKEFTDCDLLIEHTVLTHKTIDVEAFISQRIISKDVPLKVDVRHLGCKICDIPLTSVEDLIAHIVGIHEAEYDYSAGVCAIPFILNKDLLQCVLCEENFDNFTSMMKHMHKKHMEHSYICEICGQSYIDKTRLKRHMSKSHVGHRCKFCGVIFEAVHQLERHKERIHGVQKTIECNLCSTSFMSQYQLKVHMGKIHDVEKYRLKCEHCPKVCATKGAMMLHVQCKHCDAKFECDMCAYKTGIKWLLKLHKRKHFGEKNYVCSICDKRFGRSSNLRAHMKVHTGNCGRVCRRCRQGYPDLETLEKHEKELH